MTDSLPGSRGIRILDEGVSRKIAAGEVIDRPFSIVRELLDNAIDAGARAIDLYLEAGGISRVRVVDDGSGMGAEDLALCWRPHATSKIETADDLLTVRSLGFRGEALSSMAVAGRLEIVSSTNQGEGVANRIIVRGGKLLDLEECRGRKGTAAEVSELFFDFPARKRFLKTPSAESGLCRSAFVDRAVPHPSIGFRLFADGELRLFLPPARQEERIVLACGLSEQGLDERSLTIGEARGEGFNVRVVAGGPSLRRRDRRLLQIFVNRRRVPEFSLMQAVEYGFAGHIPGGWHPVAFVFIDIDPDLVDFNIHPAKKEVRFRSIQPIHSAVVRAAQGLLGGLSPAAPSRSGDFSWSEGSGVEAGGRRGPAPGFAGALFTPPASRPGGSGEMGGERTAAPARFLGQVFGVFLVFETEEGITFLDQHAAHEKVIFEKLEGKRTELQELLVPLYFDVSKDEDRALSGKKDALAAMGIEIERLHDGSYRIVSLAAHFSSLPEGDLLEMLKDSLLSGEEWRRDFLARAACRMAIKEGDAVDPVTAMELFGAALSLHNPRCPHGRPIWHRISRKDLYGSVDRPLP